MYLTLKEKRAWRKYQRRIGSHLRVLMQSIASPRVCMHHRLYISKSEVPFILIIMQQMEKLVQIMTLDRDTSHLLPGVNRGMRRLISPLGFSFSSREVTKDWCSNIKRECKFQQEEIWWCFGKSFCEAPEEGVYRPWKEVWRCNIGLFCTNPFSWEIPLTLLLDHTWSGGGVLFRSGKWYSNTCSGERAYPHSISGIGVGFGSSCLVWGGKDSIFRIILQTLGGGSDSYYGWFSCTSGPTCEYTNSVWNEDTRKYIGFGWETGDAYIGQVDWVQK